MNNESECIGHPPSKVKLSQSELVAMAAKGRDTWNNWVDANPETIVDFSAATFGSDVSFEGFRFPEQTTFKKAKFVGDAHFNEASFLGNCIFDEATFSRTAEFIKASFSGEVSFTKASFGSDVLFGEANFSGRVDFDEASFFGFASFQFLEFPLSAAFNCVAFKGGANFENTKFIKDAYFSGTVFSGIISFCGTEFLNTIHFKESTLQNADLRFTKLNNAILVKANLNGANLEGSFLMRANLGGASLRGIKVDYTTEFTGSFVQDCIIDRYALDSLKNYGGLTVGQRMDMEIVDDVASLSTSYSGINLWIHITALIGFAFPYLWFLFSLWSAASFLEDSDIYTMPLWKAFARYIWNGGVDWQNQWKYNYSFIVFVLLLLYNIARGALLWKTNQLEHKQRVSGLPVRFVLIDEAFWGGLVQSMKYLFWVALLFLIYNTYHFMTQLVPVTPF